MEMAPITISIHDGSRLRCGVVGISSSIIIFVDFSSVLEFCLSLRVFELSGMDTNKNYQLGLMYLVHLLINADGVIDEKERSGLKKVQALEHIPDSLFKEFENEIANKKEREIYQQGIEMINE